jgi:hypothetical protein
MQKRSILFKPWPLSDNLRFALYMNPKVCICSFKVWARFEDLQLFMKARKCSLYLQEMNSFLTYVRFTAVWIYRFM